MNQGQQRFHDFFLGLVQRDKQEQAEALLAVCFEKQAEGAFDAAFLNEIKPKLFALVRPECEGQLKAAMAHFAGRL